jgi:hypothetical protein
MHIMKFLFWPTEPELQESLQVCEEKRKAMISNIAALNEVTMSRLSCRLGSSYFIAAQVWGPCV